MRKVALATEGALLLGGVIVTAEAPDPKTSCSSTGPGLWDFSCNTSGDSSLKIIGPALILAAVVGLMSTAVGSASDEPAPRKLQVPAEPPRVVGNAGAQAELGVVEAFGLAKHHAAEHGIAIDPTQLHAPVFDPMTRQWVFEWADAGRTTVMSVHESGMVTTSMRGSGAL
jgi:hypothetical protein